MPASRTDIAEVLRILGEVSIQDWGEVIRLGVWATLPDGYIVATYGNRPPIVVFKDDHLSDGTTRLRIKQAEKVLSDAGFVLARNRAMAACSRGWMPPSLTVYSLLA